jgi:hypothetical protein
MFSFIMTLGRTEHQRRRLVELLVAEITRTTGRRYRIQLGALDEGSLRELQRLLRDLDHEKQMAVRQTQLQRWRR